MEMLLSTLALKAEELGLTVKIDTDTPSLLKIRDAANVDDPNWYRTSYNGISEVVALVQSRMLQKSLDTATINFLQRGTGVPQLEAPKPVVNISPASAEEEAGQTTLFPKYPKELHEGDEVELFPNPGGTIMTVDEIIAGGPSFGSFRLLSLCRETTETNGDVIQTWRMVGLPIEEREDIFIYDILVNKLDPSEADEKTHEG